MCKYTIGIDYGTQSGRVIVVDTSSGEIVGEAVSPYLDGVICNKLPGSDVRLPEDWALENPEDFLNVLKIAVPEAVKKSKVDIKDIIGIGVDFTSCTMMPVSKEGKVLCQYDEYKDRPHAWCKLWKHHAAQEEANRLNSIAMKRNEEFLSLYGGKISSEWMIPKIWQILNEDSQIYDEAFTFMEATDWITMQMTDLNVRNSCTAGYKAMWNKQKGYPNESFFEALDPRLTCIVKDKLKGPILAIGEKAGVLSSKMAMEMGLNPGIAVAVGNIDAHVAAPAVQVTEPGKLLMIMGTSSCNILLANEEKSIPGICGVVEDGSVPGYFAYEAGQSAVGDIYEWFVTHCIPESYSKEALEQEVNIHTLLELKASKLKPGESGLLALDWWNGNRSCLVDADLTGLFIGMSLQTKPEELYRTLIEATAFGQRMIIENFRKHGIAVDELYACGGLSEKNKMLMQIYADITNMEIKISASKQTPALGSAIYAAVAAGEACGGYDSVFEGAQKMAHLKDETYSPKPENVRIYNKLYAEYVKLHDYFGKGENNIMKKLKKIRETVCYEG